MCWSTKAAISLKGVKIEEKLLWKAYRNSPTLFWTVSSPNGAPLRPPLPQDWGSQPPREISIAIIPGTGKGTNLKFCTHIHSIIDRNKIKPIKNFGKSSRGCSQGLSKNFRAPTYRAHRSVIFAIAHCSAFLLADRTACSMIGYRHDTVVCLSVCTSVSGAVHCG